MGLADDDDEDDGDGDDNADADDCAGDVAVVA